MHTHRKYGIEKAEKFGYGIAEEVHILHRHDCFQIFQYGFQQSNNMQSACMTCMINFFDKINSTTDGSSKKTDQRFVPALCFFLDGL